jgi:hypothetical protein
MKVSKPTVTLAYRLLVATPVGAEYGPDTNQ